MLLYMIMYQKMPFDDYSDKSKLLSSLVEDTAGKIRPTITSEVSEDISNVSTSISKIF